MKMNYKYFLIQFCLIILSFSIFGQTNIIKAKNDSIYAKEELQKAIANPKQDNYLILNHIIVKDSLAAVAIAEPILFGIYGKTEILSEKPYKIFHINNYWILEGTLHADEGGVFLIIINDRNCQVIKIIHGK